LAKLELLNTFEATDTWKVIAQYDSSFYYYILHVSVGKGPGSIGHYKQTVHRQKHAYADVHRVVYLKDTTCDLSL